MPNIPRKKSPRAPSIALDEAIERAKKAYEKEKLHPAPTDVVAQNLGYKGISSGTALSALASLRYYGLLERPKEGFLAVTKDLEAYMYAPSPELRREFLINFLRRPALFAELLDNCGSGLPSDANLKYDLIQRGFAPASAAGTVAVFRRSVEFAGAFNGGGAETVQPVTDLLDAARISTSSPFPATDAMAQRLAPVSRDNQLVSAPLMQDAGPDRIPIRLRGKRVAWLIVPDPFYAADKERLKAQIDLLLTDDDEGAAD